MIKMKFFIYNRTQFFVYQNYFSGYTYLNDFFEGINRYSLATQQFSLSLLFQLQSDVKQTKINRELT